MFLLQIAIEPFALLHHSVCTYAFYYYRDQTWINIRQVPWEVLKAEAEGRGFQHLPRDLANVNALKKTCSIAIIA